MSETYLTSCLRMPSFHHLVGGWASIFLNPFPYDKFLDSSELKDFADDNFKFEENGRNFSKRVENTVGKRQIACSEQFLLLPWCFQKTCTANM